MECFNFYKDKDYYVGIDPSLNATGLVMINDQGEVVEERLITTYPDNYLCIEQRLLDILNDIKFVSCVGKLRKINIEALSFMSPGITFHERCGLLFLITTFLFDNEIEFETIPPKSLKKWAVGKGNADKKVMMELSEKRWGVKFTDDNICDAYNLAQMARLR